MTTIAPPRSCGNIVIDQCPADTPVRVRYGDDGPPRILLGVYKGAGELDSGEWFAEVQENRSTIRYRIPVGLILDFTPLA